MRHMRYLTNMFHEPDSLSSSMKKMTPSETIASQIINPNGKGCIAAKPANAPVVEQARICKEG